MTSKKALGRYGEQLTCKYIRNIGMQVLMCNYHKRSGEIDIIARDGETTVFIEVKTRKSIRFGTPGESITATKIQKIIATANHYIVDNNLFHSSLRFDVSEVIIEDNECCINYIKNAFEG